MMIKWRHPPGLPLLLVSNWGEVKTKAHAWASPRLLLPWQNTDGYLTVQHRGKKWFVHHLVLTAFRGPRPSRRHEGHHADSHPANNCLSNLFWVLPAQNRAAQSVRSRSLKLSVADIERIRTVEATDEEWAQLFKVRLATIRTVRQSVHLCSQIGIDQP